MGLCRSSFANPDPRRYDRAAARLAATQALYQHEMEGTPVIRLLHEFHQHRLGATIEDAEYADVVLTKAGCIVLDQKDISR